MRWCPLGDLPLCALPCMPRCSPSPFQQTCRRLAKGASASNISGVQVLILGFSVLHLISSEADTPAALALVTTLRKRLANLPGDPATDSKRRVRSPRVVVVVQV